MHSNWNAYIAKLGPKKYQAFLIVNSEEYWDNPSFSWGVPKKITLIRLFLKQGISNHCSIETGCLNFSTVHFPFMKWISDKNFLVLDFLNFF